MDINSNILKPKNTSPIRKGKGLGVGSKPSHSARALRDVTGEKRKVVRKKKVNDEDKENCEGSKVTRGAVGVNGSTTTRNTKHTKNTKPVKKETRDGRLPLKELPLNGFLERLKKSDVAASVDIVVRRCFAGADDRLLLWRIPKRG
jgi:hypothetical protein